MRKTHLKSFVFEKYFIGDYSSTFYLFDDEFNSNMTHFCKAFNIPLPSKDVLKNKRLGEINISGDMQ